MIFNLNLKTVQKLKAYPDKSAAVYFCSSNKEFDQIVKSQKFKINQLQIKNFKDNENSEIKIWSEGKPSLSTIKKVEINNKLNVDAFRNYLAGFIMSIEKDSFTSIFIFVPKFDKYKDLFTDEKYFYQTIIEGVLLGNYNFNFYKSDKSNPKKLNISFIASNKKIFDQALINGVALIEGVNFSRDLVNEPANTLTPAEYAKRIRTEFNGTGVSVKVFDEKELAKRKMNAVLSVGKASSNKPRMIIAHYKPKVKSKKKIALVGKGVTYDTGGLSIKPTSGMLEMKADMAGSATVFGIIKAASQLKWAVEIIGIVPAVENVISGNAYKPGDIISTASGKTIEVKDTDAEGRIVLADALHYASKLKPDEIIDFATLTGAVAVALGLFTAGIFTKNEKMSNGIINAGEITYEHAWRLPFWDEYNKLLESKIADVSNLGPRWGGAITAGKFLEHFVDDKIPWAHIDLAGPALAHDLTNYTKDYCTGYGVRLIAKYLEEMNSPS